MKEQTTTGTVTTLIRQIFCRFVSTRTAMPGFGKQQKSCAEESRYSSTASDTNDMVIMNMHDLPQANDYDSTY